MSVRRRVGTTDVGTQPGDKVCLMGEREHVVPAVGTDVGTVAPCRAAIPVRRRVRGERHRHLRGEVPKHGHWHGIATERETPLVLKGFQQDGEGEPGCPRLLPEQAVVVVRERPMLGEFVRVPGLLHRACSSPGGMVNARQAQAYHFVQR